MNRVWVAPASLCSPSASADGTLQEDERNKKFTKISILLSVSHIPTFALHGRRALFIYCSSLN